MGVIQRRKGSVTDKNTSQDAPRHPEETSRSSSFINYLLTVLTLMFVSSSGYIYIRYLRADTFGQLREPTRQEYDYIIAGGGTAGCVLAARLSADPDVTVLLLEAGEPASLFTRLAMRVPLLAPLLQGSDIDWAYRTVPQTHAAFGTINNSIRLPAGKTLGGSTALNFMINTPNSPADYDDWSEKAGWQWSYKEMSAYLDKVQKKYRASPLPPTPLSQAFLNAGKELGLPTLRPNKTGAQSGFLQHRVHINSGERFHAHDVYLRPAIHRKNLDVVVGAHVNRVIFNGPRAIGAEYLTHGMQRVATVKCRREVMVCAGAVGSPAILIRSGVGPSEHLKELGIPIISNRPVGYNLADHVIFGTYVKIRTRDSINKETLLSPTPFLEYWKTRKGVLALPGAVTAIGFLGGDGNVFTERSDLELYFMEIGSIKDDNAREMGNVRKEFWDSYFPEDNGPGSHGFFLGLVLTRPGSRGRVGLVADGPWLKPWIDPRYLTDKTDTLRLVEGVKFVHKLVEKSEAFKKFGAEVHHPDIEPCREYGDRTDRQLACHIKHMSGSSWHLAGTCRMGIAGDKEAVLDQNLRVLGVEGVRVMDASIFPTVPSANPTVAILAMAERAADLIIEEKDEQSYNTVSSWT